MAIGTCSPKDRRRSNNRERSACFKFHTQKKAPPKTTGQKLKNQILQILGLRFFFIAGILFLPVAVEVGQHGAGQVVPNAKDRAGNCGHRERGESG